MRHAVTLVAVALAALAAQAGASVITSRAQAEAASQDAERLAAHQRAEKAELFDQREKHMHPAATPAVKDALGGSADDHGWNIRPPGPEEEQDPSFWKMKAKKSIEENLLLRKEIKGVAKNVIIFMGDGMSVPTLAATRMYLGNENTELSFEKFPTVGLSKTYCVDTQVADSACSATAYLCGVKANMGTMGVSAKVPRYNCTMQKDAANHVDSVVAWGMEAGKWGGVVTTTRITHASPGGAYAHIANRDWEDDADMAGDANAVGADADCKDIARQLVEDAPGKDLRVILGGGRRAFVPKGTGKGKRLDGKNLVDEWKTSKSGSAASYVSTKQELDAVDPAKTDYLLGLFEWSHIQYHLEADETQPTLENLVEKAVKVLSRNEKGFVLFVEGGRIDHGHHDTMAHLALDETAEFSKAIQKAVDMTSAEETLIAVTSDHAHTMSMAGYAMRGNYIFDFGGFDEKSKEVYTTISYANGPGYHAEADGSRHDPSLDDRNSTEYMFPATAWLNSETHGGDDVGIFARGPWAHLYTGVHEQNMIPNIAAYAAAIGPFKGRSTDGGDASGAASVQVALVSLLSALMLPLVRLL